MQNTNKICIYERYVVNLRGNFNQADNMTKRDTILTAALDAEPITKNDYERFLGEQITNVLYVANTPISATDLKERLAKEGVYVTEDQLDKVLRSLEGKYLPKPRKGSMISLSEDGRKKIATRIYRLKESETGIIKKYFLNGIDSPEETVKMWLNDTLLLIFQRYFSTVLSHMIKDSGKVELENFNIEEECKPIFEKYGMHEEDRKILCHELRRMLDTVFDPNVNYLIQYYLNVAYKSKVTSSKTFVAPDIAEEFKGKVFYLDTNVLIALQLEKANRKKINFEAIVDLCKKLNIRFKCLSETKCEYQNVLAVKREKYRELMTGYSLRVFEGARANNILEALKNRGCYSEYAVNHFFDEFLSAVPTHLYNGEIEIEPVDVQDAKGPYYYYNRIQEAKNRFKTIFVENDNESDYEDYGQETGKHVLRKSDAILEHDLGLIGVVRTERGLGEFAKAHKYQENDIPLLLTMDGSVVMYAQSQYPNEKFVYNIRDLIVLLSLNRGGMLDAKENFAPILQHFVANHFITWEDVYDVKDLALIYNIETQVASLDETQVVQIAKEVNKMRREHKNKEQIRNYLSKELNLALAKSNEMAAGLQLDLLEKDKHIQQQDEQIANLLANQRNQTKREFFRLYNDKCKKRNKQKFLYWAMNIVLCIIIVLELIFNWSWLMAKIESFGWLKVILNSNIIKGVSVIWATIAVILDIVGFRHLKQKSISGYFDKATIRDEVLDEMGCDDEMRLHLKEEWEKNQMLR